MQLQLLQQQPPSSQSIPSSTHIQLQSSLPKQQINFHQPSLMSPPGNSSTSSSTSGSTGSIQGSVHHKSGSNISANELNTNDEDRKMKDKCLYLKQLLQDKKQIQSLSGFFLHADRILDEG